MPLSNVSQGKGGSSGSGAYEKFDWEKAYQFVDGMVRLSELCLDAWKEDKSRERKLAESPGGFQIDGRYTCAICGHHSFEDRRYWYDRNGIKCMTCQEAINRGEIPASVATDRDSWYSVSDIEHIFAVKAKVIRKWVKAGVLKARTIAQSGQKFPLQIFLLEDSRDTLPPKGLVKDRLVKEWAKDGKEAFYHEPWFCFENPAEYLKGYKILEHLQKITEDERNTKYIKLSVVPAIPYLYFADTP